MRLLALSAVSALAGATLASERQTLDAAGEYGSLRTRGPMVLAARPPCCHRVNARLLTMPILPHGGEGVAGKSNLSKTQRNEFVAVGFVKLVLELHPGE